MKGSSLLILLLFAALPVRLSAQTAPLLDSIQTILTKGIAARAFPGAQVLVYHRGAKVAHLTAGHHTYARRRAVRPDDIYDLASITKTSSGLLYLMRAYERGEIGLDDPLGELFPGVLRGEKGRRTLRSALSHRAGLLPWVPYWQTTLRRQARYPWRKGWDAAVINDYDFRRRTLRRDSSRRYPIRIGDDLWLHRKFRERWIERAIRKSPVKPEGQYAYSGLLFYLLPELVERRTGREYRTYLREEFYDPLGATTLGYRPLERGWPLERIVPTEVDTFFRMDTLHGVVHDEGAALMDGVSGNAGLFATGEDLAKLYLMLLNGGEAGGRRYFAQATIDTFTRRHYAAEGNRRGLGFDKPEIELVAGKNSVAQRASAASFGHSGYTGTLVWADPEADLLFVFLSNRVHPTRLARSIYTLHLRPRIHELVYRLVDTLE